MGWTEYVEVLSNFIMGMRADVHVILNLVRDWRGCKYDAIRAAPLLQHVLLIVVTCLLLTCVMHVVLWQPKALLPMPIHQVAGLK